MSELIKAITLDEVEQHIAALPQADREAWLAHICKRFGVAQPMEIREVPYPVYPTPSYPLYPPWTITSGTMI